jgi:spermidine synthase
MDLLEGQKILEESKSPVNGKIVVLKTLGLGIHIQVEGLTQSGSVVYDIWKETLKKTKKKKKNVNNALILGLGGGSAATLVKKYWKEASITGVDIDPVFVEMGKKYLGLDDIDVEVIIKDASEYIGNVKKEELTYDLILVDMYVGYEVPRQFTTVKFIKDIKGLLTDDGIAIFNRLYFDDKRTLAMSFAKKLDEIFDSVEYVYPEANVMFLCKK